MTGDFDQKTTAIIFTLAQKLELDPLEINPEVIGWLESEVQALAKTPVDEAQARLEETQQRVADLERRDVLAAEYFEYAQELNYRAGFNDGQYLVVQIVETALEDDPQTKAKLKQVLPDRVPTPAFSHETRP